MLKPPLLSLEGAAAFCLGRLGGLRQRPHGGLGTGGADRMVVYVNHERFLQVEELVPLARVMSQPNATEFCYDTAYAANLSEVELFYPQTMAYFDGI